MPGGSTPALHSRLGQILALFDTRDQPDWSVAEIAEALGISPTQAGTACAVLATRNGIFRMNSGRYCAMPDVHDLPAQGARPGLELRPYVGFTIPRQEVHHAPQ